MLARPSLRHGTSRNGFAIGPTAAMQYAENPPKKYEDIYPFDFECESGASLWVELKDVVAVLDRPRREDLSGRQSAHQAFPFWRWLIEEIQAEYPDVIFLAEAFTRPKVMYDLAKLGFSQSYTYFAWRNTKEAIDQLFYRACRGRMSATSSGRTCGPTRPTSSTEFLQFGGRPGIHGAARPGRDAQRQLRHLRPGI